MKHSFLYYQVYQETKFDLQMKYVFPNTTKIIIFNTSQMLGKPRKRYNKQIPQCVLDSLLTNRIQQKQK